MPFLLPVSLSNQGSFPPPALPGLTGTTSPSATLPAQPAPHGGPVGVCSPPTGLPVLLPSPSSMRAAATTPAEPASARVARFPASGSLPRDTVGSASALHVSRPARRSLALRPAWSPGRPRQPVPSECFRPCRCLHRPLRLLPAGATVAGRDSHPLGDGAFPRHTVSHVRVRPRSRRRGFARLPLRPRAQRQARDAPLSSVPPGFLRAGAKQEAKRPADAASSCLILPRISQGQAFTRNYFKNKEQSSASGRRHPGES